MMTVPNGTLTPHPVPPLQGGAIACAYRVGGVAVRHRVGGKRPLSLSLPLAGSAGKYPMAAKPPGGGNFVATPRPGGDGREAETAFPPPVRGRDRERGGTLTGDGRVPLDKRVPA